MPIVTFYSYKGGTGRSMALANVAWILASNGQRVLVVDWDLEAPGLHRYFRPFLTDKELTGPDSQGVIDFVVDFSVKMATPPTGDLEEKWYQRYADISKWSKRLLWPSGEIANPGVKGSIDFVPAGQQGQQYGQKVNSFDWANFYEQLNGGAFFDAVRRSMTTYDWVLIDSRTGVSDTAGICTLQLPDILVVCFTLNYQSINGALAVASAVKKARPAITIWPVPTRIDGSEEKLLNRMKGYAQSRFSPLLNRYVDPVPYWYGMEVPYFARYAYSEKLAPFEDQIGISTSTLPAMERLTDWITGGKFKKLLPLPEKDRKQSLAEFEAPPESLQLGTAAPDDRRAFQKWIDQWMERTSITVKKLGSIPVLASILIGIIASLGSNQFFEWFKPRNTFDVLLSGAQKDIQSGRTGARDHAALLLAEAAKLRQVNSGTSPFDASNKADTKLLDLFYSLGPLQSGSTRHKAAVRIVRFNRDGTLVVTASDDKTSRAFRADGSSGPDWSVTNSGWAVDFSPDGKYLACGTDNGDTAIYDAQSLRLLFWTRQQGAVQKVVFSPDSQTFLSAADNVRG